MLKNNTENENIKTTTEPTNTTQTEDKEEPKKKHSLSERIIIVILVIIIIILLLLKGCGGFGSTTSYNNNTNTNLAIDKTQNAYVEPESPVNRSKQISLPGWGGFTIPANTKDITQGFEFHNPQENIWYEDAIYINDTFIEKMVVDSGEKTSLTHLVRLANTDSKAVEVTSADETYFSISEDILEDGGEKELCIEAIAPFEEDQTVTVKCENGKEVTLNISCNQDYYYMTFALYIGDPEDTEEDTLLYQSGLVEPGMYIQQMEMTQALEPGVYDVYVDIQPYKSDKTTKTNSGTVKITLTVG